MKKMLALASLLVGASACMRTGTAEFALSYPVQECPRVAVRYIPIGCESTTRTLNSVAPFNTEDQKEEK
jgi:hypothetical protein